MAGIIQEVARHMTRIFFAVMLFFLLSPPIQGQVNQWPVDLQIPEAVKPDRTDSNDITLLSQRALYMNAVTASDSFIIKRSDQSYDFHILDYYRLERNDLFKSKKQYFDLSGTAFKKKVLFPWLSIGFDWMPVVLVNSSGDNQALLGSLDAGPAIHSDFFSLPITLKGGLAGKVQNDSFAINDNRQAFWNHSIHDKGFYGAFEVGSENTSFSSLPLVINAKGFGRSLNTSHLFSGMGSALFCRDFLSGDTLSLLYADSVIDGGGAMLGDEGAQGKSLFIDIPQSITRSYQIKGGIHGKFRLNLQPALFVSYARHYIEYPTDKNSASLHTEWADRQNSMQSINAMINSDPSRLVNYSGGLRIDFEKEVKLFKNDIKLDTIATSSNKDTLKIKLNDYNGYKATMQHALSVYSKNGAGIDYSYSISRYLKTYPFNKFVFRDITNGTSEMFRNDDDKDWIVQNHHVALTPFSKQWGEMVFSGEYSTNLCYFLKGRKSANNSVDYFYKLGVNSFFYALENVKIENNLISDVKRTEYVFPDDYAKLGFLPPSYSREITMQTALSWHNRRFPDCKLEWDEHYEDDGYWYGKESIDSGTTKADSGTTAIPSFYGIERRQWRHSCALSVSDTISRLICYELGSSIEFIDQKKYNAQERVYSRDDSQTRYIIVPFLTIETMSNRFFNLGTKIKRTIDTVKEDYWDFSLVLNVRF
jgi:hypothetical protein